MMRTLRSSNFAMATNASSSATSSADFSSENVSASSSENFFPPPPRCGPGGWGGYSTKIWRNNRRPHAVKWPPALPFGKVLLYQPPVSFVDQRGWLQCVIRALPPQIAMSQFVKLVVDDRHQLFE